MAPAASVCTGGEEHRRHCPTSAVILSPRRWPKSSRRCRTEGGLSQMRRPPESSAFREAYQQTREIRTLELRVVACFRSAAVATPTWCRNRSTAPVGIRAPDPAAHECPYRKKNPLRPDRYMLVARTSDWTSQ